MSLPHHTLSNFSEALKALRSDVLHMGELGRQELEQTSIGLFERQDEVCHAVEKNDEAIDLLEMQIDRSGVDIIMRFQPVATDLRHVVASMRISNNVERVADQAVNIARRARKLNQHSPLPEIDALKPMFAYAISMYEDALKAYQEENLEVARNLKARDRELDRINKDLADRFVECMRTHPDQIKEYLHCVLIARALERIGDQSTNIAEDTVYVFAAEDIRHQTKKKD